MTQRWEYLTVWHTEAVRPKDPNNLEAGWEWQYVAWIDRPGSTEKEKRETEWGVTRLSIRGLLDELGSEGWELVSEVVHQSRMTSGLYGWSGAQSDSMGLRLILKRPA
jgi:hypothetical protein